MPNAIDTLRRALDAGPTNPTALRWKAYPALADVEALLQAAERATTAVDDRLEADRALAEAVRRVKGDT